MKGEQNSFFGPKLGPNVPKFPKNHISQSVRCRKVYDMYTSLTTGNTYIVNVLFVFSEHSMTKLHDFLFSSRIKFVKSSK